MIHSPEGVQKYPDYEKPPVIEVVCGVLFKPLSGFLTPHVGLLWEKYRGEYPDCSEVAPLGPMLESFEETPQMSLEILNVPPLPRVWFVHKDGNRVIQIQRDRFLHNWRKAKSEEDYPRYHFVKDMFQKSFSKFESFLADNGISAIEPLQYEMTYISHIAKGDGWESLGEIGKLFPDFNFDSKRRRFLPEPDTINWRTTFVLPQNAARMHVVIRNVRMRDSGKPVILLELKVRGIGTDRSIRGMWGWFDLAREWIVCGFSDLTADKVQREVWRKIQ